MSLKYEPASVTTTQRFSAPQAMKVEAQRSASYEKRVASYRATDMAEREARKRALAHVPGARTVERVAAKRGPERTSASSPAASSAGGAALRGAVLESPEVSERPLHEHLSAAQETKLDNRLEAVALAHSRDAARKAEEGRVPALLPGEATAPTVVVPGGKQELSPRRPGPVAGALQRPHSASDEAAVANLVSSRKQEVDNIVNFAGH